MLAVIQFDCGVSSLIDELIDAGRLPTLAGLRETGRWQALGTPALHFPAGTYHTLYSGRPLGEQSQHYAFMWDPARQRVSYRTAFPAPKTVWERAAEAGKTALIVDPYESHLPGAIDGTVLSGWQFENVMSLERWSSPASADREMGRLFGRPPLLQEVFGRPTAKYLMRVRKLLLAGPERVASVATHLIARDEPELVWIAMMASHLAGHWFWDLSRFAGDFDPDVLSVLEGTLAEVYEATDVALGRIIRALPDDADLIVFSPMGMGPEYSRVDILPGMLDAVLSGKPAAGGDSGLLWKVRDAVPVEARAVVARLTGRRLTQQLTTRLSTARTDWSRTRAFMVPSDHHGQIRFNVRGRERDGIVAPEDVDALAAEITDGLLSFRESDGSRSIAEVWRTRELMPDAPHVDMLPDLVVRFNPTLMPADGVSRSDRHGEVRRAGVGTGRTGGHNTDAWIALRPGAARLRDVERPEVVDIPATVCALLGLPADDVAGDPLLEPVPVPTAQPA
jgi:predicted AlkP superfamily phosphohydrolase/phosphomutase